MRRSRSRVQPLPSPIGVPLLVVLSGPSGVGKDAVLNRMKQAGYAALYVTTMTTRARRPREKDGVHYDFVSVDKFHEMIRNGELLEWANVYGNWYGVPRRPVKQALDSGQDAIVKVDVQGAATIKGLLPEAISIFLLPPSMDELMMRLRQRHTESAFDLELRLKTAEDEMKQLAQFDYAVVNEKDGLDRAVFQIEAILTAEKCRVNPRRVAL